MTDLFWFLAFDRCFDSLFDLICKFIICIRYVVLLDVLCIFLLLILELSESLFLVLGKFFLIDFLLFDDIFIPMRLVELVGGLWTHLFYLTFSHFYLLFGFLVFNYSRHMLLKLCLGQWFVYFSDLG